MDNLQRGTKGRVLIFNAYIFEFLLKSVLPKAVTTHSPTHTPSTETSRDPFSRATAVSHPCLDPIHPPLLQSWEFQEKGGVGSRRKEAKYEE